MTRAVLCGLLLCRALSAQAQLESRLAYQLGAGDQILIRIPEVEEINDKATRLDELGDINLAMLGRVHAAGLTAHQLEEALNERLKRLVLRPAAVVTVTEMRSQPVAVAGAVRNPGIIQLQGTKSLLEVLSLAGGMAPEAGYRIQITRPVSNGPLPLSNTRADVSGRFHVGEIVYKGLLDGTNPAGNIAILANDVITVPRAEIIYVMGDVRKPGGFALADNEKVSALQALAMAEGALTTAATSRAVIKRLVAGERRDDIPVNLAQVLSSKIPDVILQPNDILVIPNSATKRMSTRALEMLLQAGLGVAIYRR